jgi:GNAT superfamily N-acetyltransferase
VDARLPDVAHVGFVETTEDVDVQKTLFDSMKDVATSMGVHTLRGPVNFNTWQDFRAVENSAQPPFFLEPYARNVAALWRAQGFESRLQYVSLAQEVSSMSFVDVARPTPDISIELLRPDTVQDAVAGLHRVALSGFFDTWSFIPITEEEFVYLYELPLARLDIFRIFVAREGGEIVGFLVCALDTYDAKGKRLVVKSMAVHKEHQKKGAGSALLAELQRHALESGIQTCVFSTMQTGNTAIHRLIRGEELRVYEVGECRV